MERKKLGILVISLCCSLAMFSLIGCSSQSSAPEETSENGQTEEAAEDAQSDVLQTDDMTVTGVFLDESYAGSDTEKDVKRLYVFSDITANSGTLKVSSAGFELTAQRDDATDTLSSMDVIQNDTDGGSSLESIASSYSCTNVITEILPGSSAKIAIPFNVPAFYLQEGATFSLSSSYSIDDGITFGFAAIQDAENLNAIAQAIDAEGYAAAMAAREDASPELAEDVMSRLNGYEYYESTGGLTQRYAFEGDRFVAKTLGAENPGTYTVKNGYLACLQDSTGWVTWILWEFSDKYDNGITIDIGDAFVEK